MAAAQPLLHDEVFIEEHRRIRLRLLRLRKFTSPESGFPSALSCLVACVDEIDGLLPELIEHFAREERILYGNADPEASTAPPQVVELLLAEHQPLVRELRALLDSGRQVLEELRSGQNAGSMAEALKVYLSACVQDLIDHEEKERALLTGA